MLQIRWKTKHKITLTEATYKNKYINLNLLVTHMTDNHESMFSLQGLEQILRLGFKLFSLNFFIFHFSY